MDSSGELTESLLIITGTMGAGKTTVLAEASDIHARRQIAHAAIDLIALRITGRYWQEGLEAEADFAIYGRIT